MKTQEYKTDILIVGGGLGGVAAALSALRLGCSVIVVEDSDWIGGQLTTQGVPPDENPWIDSHQTGCTSTYRKLRENIREYYRQNYPLLDRVKNNPHFNPGQGNVSPLCHEPKVSLAVLNNMLSPYLASGQLTLWLNHNLTRAEVEADYIKMVGFSDCTHDIQRLVHFEYVIDATDLGDLIPLAGVEHVTGAESQKQTQEMHALPDEENPLDQQSFSWCFAVDYLLDEDNTIEKPRDYDFWKTYQAEFWPGPQLSWIYPNPVDLTEVNLPLFTGPREAEKLEDMWHFRRILYRKHYPEGAFPSDITLVNWPQSDYWRGPLVDVSEEEKQNHLTNAQQLSLSLLYWMQTEAPRTDRGYGYPELRLRGDILGTDSLAKKPYIRESRRIQAEFTVLEEHIGVEQRGALVGAEIFPDSVGIGSYRIDLHPSSSGRNYIDINSWPFQIPLGALLPSRVENYLPAGKNIGSTHITNGCYRLHPVEWNIGEAAGALAAISIKQGLKPRQIRNSPDLLKEFQSVLENRLGFELAWPEELRVQTREKMDPLGI
ncbi:MAG: FAD-dependent oxidoreductase [Anaerolineales bacterium]|nr:FAD-dependent oxidoreductase [Anaerolineales bacterium]